MPETSTDPGLPESFGSDIRKIFEEVLNPALAPIETLVRDVQDITKATESLVRILPSVALFGFEDVQTVVQRFSGTLGERGMSSLSTALDTSSPSQAFYNVDLVQVAQIGAVDPQDMSQGPQFGMGVTEPLRAVVSMTNDQANGLPAFCDWANGAKGGFPVTDHGAFAFAFLDQPEPPGEPQWQAAVTTFIQSLQADMTRYAALPSLDPGSRQILMNLLETLSDWAVAMNRALDGIGRLELSVFEKHNPEIGSLLPQSALQSLQSEASQFVGEMEALDASGGAVEAQSAGDIRRKLAQLIAVKQALQGLQRLFPLEATLNFAAMVQANAGANAGISVGAEATAGGSIGVGGTVDVGVGLMSIMALFTQSSLLALAIYETALNFSLIKAAD